MSRLFSLLENLFTVKCESAKYTNCCEEMWPAERDLMLPWTQSLLLTIWTWLDVTKIWKWIDFKIFNTIYTPCMCYSSPNYAALITLPLAKDNNWKLYVKKKNNPTYLHISTLHIWQIFFCKFTCCIWHFEIQFIKEQEESLANKNIWSFTVDINHKIWHCSKTCHSLEFRRKLDYNPSLNKLMVVTFVFASLPVGIWVNTWFLRYL